jgi:hypothetical protein
MGLRRQRALERLRDAFGRPHAGRRSRRKLPPTPANPRNARVGKTCSRRESPPIPAQPASATTGLAPRFGVGIALCYATLGRLDFEGRFDYGAVGLAVNLASRLGNEAGEGKVLLSPRMHAEVEDVVEAEPVGRVRAEGLPRSGSDRERRCASGGEHLPGRPLDVAGKARPHGRAGRADATRALGRLATRALHS